MSYTVIGSFTDPIRVCSSAIDVEGLGLSQLGDCVRDRQYLILPKPGQFTTRTLPLPAGGEKVLIYPDTNPGSVVLNPGGLFSESAVIIGELATTLKDKASISLYKSLRETLRNQCFTVGNIIVGQDAAAKANAGYRLCERVTGPVENDLVMT